MNPVAEYCKQGHKKLPDNVYNRSRCKICRNLSVAKWRKANLEKTRQYDENYRETHPDRNIVYDEKRWLKKLYKMTLADYNDLLNRQNGVCAICGQTEKVMNRRSNRIKRLAVDHDHTTGKIRALLCSRCNRGIGYFKEDVVSMQKAVEYIKFHNSN